MYLLFILLIIYGCCPNMGPGQEYVCIDLWSRHRDFGRALLGSKLGGLEAMLGASWWAWGPFWLKLRGLGAILAPSMWSWGHLASKLGSLGAIWQHVGGWGAHSHLGLRLCLQSVAPGHVLLSSVTLPVKYIALWPCLEMKQRQVPYQLLTMKMNIKVFQVHVLTNVFWRQNFASSTGRGCAHEGVHAAMPTIVMRWSLVQTSSA